MVRVGCHVSIAGSIDRSVDRALERTCDTFQIFTRNPRGWKSRDLAPGEVKTFRKRVAESGIGPVVAHMPYLPNLATPDPAIYARSCETLEEELRRCELLGIPYLMTHLGSHRGEGEEAARARLLQGINTAFEKAPGNVMLLLENTAGTAHSMGGTFEQIRQIMDGIREIERVGCCFDTCHGFAAGYELRTGEGIGATMDLFGSVIGLEHLHMIHLNDSKGDLGTRVDRHEHIGIGKIGEEGFRLMLHSPPFTGLPLICETPVDERRDDRQNIEKVRELAA
ncbi:MAG: deoxyribonuclease IV [Methanomicrobiaceae archaeon]|nr:deoxyribonuclease IV [Methanomicrobiaceae archaeon]